MLVSRERHPLVRFHDYPAGKCQVLMKLKQDIEAQISRIYTILVFLTAIAFLGVGLWRGSQQTVHKIDFDEYMLLHHEYRSIPHEKEQEK